MIVSGYLFNLQLYIHVFSFHINWRLQISHKFRNYGIFFMFLRGHIKITPSISPSVRLCARVFCVQDINMYSINGFPYNLAEAFGISRQCVARRTTHLSQKSRPHRQFKCKNAAISVQSVILLCMERF